MSNAIPRRLGIVIGVACIVLTFSGTSRLTHAWIGSDRSTLPPAKLRILWGAAYAPRRAVAQRANQSIAIVELHFAPFSNPMQQPHPTSFRRRLRSLVRGLTLLLATAKRSNLRPTPPAETTALGDAIARSKSVIAALEAQCGLKQRPSSFKTEK